MTLNAQFSSADHITIICKVEMTNYGTQFRVGWTTKIDVDTNIKVDINQNQYENSKQFFIRFLIR